LSDKIAAICATEDAAGRKFYFQPTSNLNLVENFQYIANDLRSLYLSQ
jgi:hypothetical protein